MAGFKLYCNASLPHSCVYKQVNQSSCIPMGISNSHCICDCPLLCLVVQSTEHLMDFMHLCCQRSSEANFTVLTNYASL